MRVRGLPPRRHSYTLVLICHWRGTGGIEIEASWASLWRPW